MMCCISRSMTRTAPTTPRAAWKPFRPFKDKPLYSMTYFQVPAEVLEEAEQLVEWSRKSCAVALGSLGDRARSRADPARERQQEGNHAHEAACSAGNSAQRLAAARSSPCPSGPRSRWSNSHANTESQQAQDPEEREHRQVAGRIVSAGMSASLIAPTTTLQTVRPIFCSIVIRPNAVPRRRLPPGSKPRARARPVPARN